MYKLLIIGLFLLIPSIYADTNGVWIDAEDVRSGTFGTDEGSGNFDFPNNLGIQNQLNIKGNENSLRLIGVDHNYIEFYPQGESSGRKGWFGYGESGSSDLTMQVDGSSNVLLNPNWGYVGIGTDSPNSALDVDGVINANNLFSNGEEVATNDYVNSRVNNVESQVNSNEQRIRDLENEVSNLENQINNQNFQTEEVEVITGTSRECVSYYGTANCGQYETTYTTETITVIK